MANPIEMRKLFLREITRALVFAHVPELKMRSKLPEIQETGKQIELALEKTKEQKIIPAKQIQTPKPIQIATPKPVRQIQTPKPIQVMRQMQPPVAKTTPKPLALAAPAPIRIMQPPRLPPLQKAQFAKIPAQTQTIDSFRRISFLIKNPAIQSIECFGAGKPLSIRKFGLNQTINLSLTADEINNIIKELSEKTKIPIVTGVFKVAFQNLLITAVISEFVGTRFIIQKREALAPQNILR